MSLDELLKNENFKQNQKKTEAEKREAERQEKAELFKKASIECFDNVVDKKIDQIINTFNKNGFWASKERVLDRAIYINAVKHSFFSVKIKNMSWQFDIVATPLTQLLEIKLQKEKQRSDLVKAFRNPEELTGEILESLIEKEISSVLS